MNTNIKIRQTLIIAFAIFTAIFLTTCKKVAAPSQPTNVSAKQEGESIIITWKEASHATSYRIYRSATGTDYIPIGTVSNYSYGLNYTDKTPFEGVNYYKVTAFNEDVESLEGGYTTCNFVPPLPPPPPPPPPGIPTNVSASQNGLTIIVSWSSVEEAIGYNVYRSSAASGEYSLISDTAISKTNYIDNCPLTGDNFYKVTAINSIGDESGLSGYAVCDFRCIPTLTTLSAINMSGNSVTLGGNISNVGNPPYTERGVCWSTSANPTTADSKKQVSGSGTGDYTTSVTSLEASKTYYVRAYAINAEGTAYGHIVSFTTLAHKIGDEYQGGIIFYINSTGQHGLIAAKQDQSTGIQWYNGDYIKTGATGTGIGNGKSNTTKIVQAQGAGIYAAKLCDDLVLNGYNDWFLPSKEELNLLYKNLIGGFFSNDYYWSSSEYSNYVAWSLYSYNGNQNSSSTKINTYRVRAVRAF